MTVATRDPIAAGRLARRVAVAYREPQSKVRNDNQLSHATGIARGTLDGYFKEGVPPDFDRMRLIAEQLGVDHTVLWAAWLDLPLPNDALERIAAALERAYPVTYRADLAQEAREVHEALDAAVDANRSAPRRARRRGGAAG